MNKIFLLLLITFSSAIFAETVNEGPWKLYTGRSIAIGDLLSKQNCIDAAKTMVPGRYGCRQIVEVIIDDVVDPIPDPVPPTPEPDPIPPSPPTTLIEGMDNSAPLSSRPNLQKGQPFTDPVYGTVLQRMTDAANEPPSGFARNDYSRRQAFNADNSLFLVYANGGRWHLYETNGNYRKQLNITGNNSEPQWNPIDPNKIYHVPNNGGQVLLEHDIRTDQSTVVANFTGRLPWPGIVHIWTKGEGSPSADGCRWGFMAENSNFDTQGIFAYDLCTDTILGTLATPNDDPDHISMSASGEYIVPSSDGDMGTRAYKADMSSFVQLHWKSSHSDLGLLSNGDDFYISVDFQTNRGDVYWINLQTGERTVLFANYVSSGVKAAMHFSGKAYDKPGYVLVGTYGAGGTRSWLHDKLFIVELETGRILNVAHIYPGGDGDSGLGYFMEPHGVISRDASKIIVNWTDQTVNVVKIDLPEF